MKNSRWIRDNGVKACRVCDVLSRPRLLMYTGYEIEPHSLGWSTNGNEWLYSFARQRGPQLANALKTVCPNLEWGWGWREVSNSPGVGLLIRICVCVCWTCVPSIQRSLAVRWWWVNCDVDRWFVCKWKSSGIKTGVMLAWVTVSWNHKYFKMKKRKRKRKKKNVGIEASLVVQWLRLHAPSAGVLGSVADGGTWSHMLQLRPAK